jgi:hypothetical protein
MKTNWKLLAFAGLGALACVAFDGSRARAQGFSFGYAGPGGSFGINTGNYGYYGVGPLGGGYYGGGYYGGYPLLAPGAFVAGPVAPVVVRPPVYVRGPLIGPGPFIGRPLVRYRAYPGFYRRGWW